MSKQSSKEPGQRQRQANAQQAVLSRESNRVGMIDERVACEMETSRGRRNNNQAEKDSGNKREQKEFTIKEHRDKNTVIINIKIDHNEL